MPPDHDHGMSCLSTPRSRFLSVPIPQAMSAALMALCTLPVHANPFDDGLRAYRTGRFDEALRAFTAAASAGDARAQRSLGLMHERGQGVPRDAAQAAHWYGQAVSRGLQAAQYNLAFLGSEPTVTGATALTQARP